MPVIRNRYSELIAAKARRENRKITQRTAAQETGLGLSTITSYSTNKVTRYDAEILRVLCEYLKCSLSDLLVMEETEERPSEDSIEMLMPA